MEVATRIIIQLLSLVICCFFLVSPGSEVHQMHEKWQCGHDQADFVHDVSVILLAALHGREYD